MADKIVVEQQVTVTHKLDGEDPFAASLKAMEAMATKLETAFGKVKDLQQTTAQENTAEKQTATQNGKQENKPIISAVTSTDKLNNSIENLINVLRTSGGVGRGRETPEEAAAKAQARQEGHYAGKLAGMQAEDAYKDSRKTLEAEEKATATWGKIAKGIAFGTATTIAYQANSMGATWGSAENIINTSGMNYNDYLISQYNKRMDAGLGIASTTITGATMGAGAALMPVNPIAGAAVMGVGAIANFGIGYFGGKSKAENEFAVNQDIESWRLQASGLSGASNKYQIDGYGRFTDFQDAMRQSKYTAFYKDAPQVLAAGRRDITTALSSSEQADFAGRTQLEALKMGVNPVELARTASNTAAITGKNIGQVLSDISANFNAYGGDIIANSNRINALVMGTSMSPETATSIVNRYQYNDAMLQNRVNDQTVSPLNRFKANVLGQIYRQMTGLDIDSAEAKRRYQKAGAEGSISPEYNIYEQAMSARGQSAWANDVGIMPTADTGQINASSQPLSLVGFADDIARALQGVTLNVKIVDGQAESSPLMTPVPKPENIPQYMKPKNNTPQSNSKLGDYDGFVINGKQIVPPIMK